MWTVLRALCTVFPEAFRSGATAHEDGIYKERTIVMIAVR